MKIRPRGQGERREGVPFQHRGRDVGMWEDLPGWGRALLYLAEPAVVLDVGQ